MSYAQHSVPWLEALDAELSEAFAGGVRYSQNLHDSCGLGKSRDQSFVRDDRDEAEEFLSATGAAWELEADGGPHVAQDRPATTRPPRPARRTGSTRWTDGTRPALATRPPGPSPRSPSP
ncbi:hypothetical protein ACIA74_31655 [Streptomyces sp. NPDC051658]|uniref:hypothetical protein n=1 Tax=Streptomyces sp. NPDC051658 TaxID=3365667 RepID=UPI00379F5576